jgi:N4-gp56 family major capsid protein
MAVTKSTDLTNSYQTFFTKTFLEHAVNILRLQEFAAKESLPQKAGAKAMRFYRPGVADSTQVQTLSESSVISSFRSITEDYIDATLAQYGEVIRLTDLLTMTSILDRGKQASMTLSEDFALFVDTLIRNALANTTTGFGRKYAQGLANFAALGAASTSAGALEVEDLLRACTALKTAKAPRINGGYVAIVPPQVSYNLMLDTAWLNAKQYSDVKDLYKGEVGQIFGVRVVEATNPWIEGTTSGEGTYDGSGGIYTSFVTGSGAYGLPALSGDSPMSPKVIVVKGADSSNPLDQHMSIGAKAFFTAVVLKTDWGVALKSKTTFV